MSKQLHIPKRAELSAEIGSDDHTVVIRQDTGGQEPEDTPELQLCIDDAKRLRDWLNINLEAGDYDGQ